MVDGRKRWKSPDLEKKVAQACERLDELLARSPVPKRGTVLADLIYRAQHTSEPDGFPTSSSSSSPPLDKPASSPALRTGPDDPLRRKREHGYATSTVERAYESMDENACEDCDGKGGKPRFGGVVDICARCGGTGNRYYDPTTDAVDTLCEHLLKVVALVAAIDKKRQVVLNAGAKAGADDRPDHCEACHRIVYGGRGDPMRRGQCGACCTAYGRWRIGNGTNDEPSDRMRFNAERDRFEGHVPGACEVCARRRERPTEDWRIEAISDLQKSGSLPTARGAG